MTTAVTTHRDAVRRGIAQIAAGITGAAIAVLVLMVSALPVDPESEFDTAGGTREYPDVDTLLSIAMLAGLTVPIAAAVGTAFGRGPCRGFCGVVLALAALFMHAQLT